MKYFCDNKRHLICVPYSIDNLHKMAIDLNIKRCWFHKNHYDIPKKRINEITDKCELITTKEIIKMNNYKLPIDYTKLSWRERKLVREQYITEQTNNCMYCEDDLFKPPPKRITDKVIDWNLFPDQFLKNKIHLQHCHKTGMTEGAVHAYCNAVLWQYEHR